MRSRLPWQVSLIELPEGMAVLDRKTGNYRLPYRPILKGYWAWTTRVADLLPDDFDPNGVD